MRAPPASKNLIRSCTCGSCAARRIVVRPFARAPRRIAFSVAVTENSGRVISAPFSSLRVIVNERFPCLSERSSIFAPNCSRIEKCVVSARFPKRHPPGSGIVIFLNRARSGPINKTEERMVFISSSSRVFSVADFVLIVSWFLSVHSIATPSDFMRSAIFRTSPTRGTLSKMQSSSIKSVAAIIGVAAFLNPFIVNSPFNVLGPLIRSRDIF